MNFWGKLLCGILVGVFLFFLEGGEVYGAQENSSRQEESTYIQNEILDDMDLTEVERAVDELLEEDLSFRDMVETMIQEGNAGLSSSWTDAGKALVLEVLGIQRKVCIHILLLVIMASLLSGFSGVLDNQQIGEISFYFIYLFLFVLLLKNFDGFSSQIQTTLEGTVGFMRALLPSYYLAMTAASGISTAAIFYQMIFVIIFLAEHLILKILLPCVRICFLMELVNYLTKEELLSKMTDLLKEVIQWTLKTMVGVILGIQMIQRLIAPAIDALKRTMLGKTAEAIPGVGNIFSGITEMVLGSAVLIKNCLGAAALVILFLAAVPPVLRLGISSVVYRFLAALAQPVTDNRMVGCVHTMGEGIGMLLKLLITVDILFFLTIAILAGSLG